MCVRARASAQPEPLCVCTRACSQNHQPPNDLAPPPPPNPSKMTTIINYSNPKPNIKTHQIQNPTPTTQININWIQHQTHQKPRSNSHMLKYLIHACREAKANWWFQQWWWGRSLVDLVGLCWVGVAFGIKSQLGVCGCDGWLWNLGLKMWIGKK